MKASEFYEKHWKIKNPDGTITAPPFLSDKENIAVAVARNLSKQIKEPVYVQVAGIKSVSSMKYIDTTVVQVFRHSELPLPVHTAEIKKVFHLGKERKL